jgi:hypothetical protein
MEPPSTWRARRETVRTLPATQGFADDLGSGLVLVGQVLEEGFRRHGDARHLYLSPLDLREQHKIIQGREQQPPAMADQLGACGELHRQASR